ncbi:DUF2642 domain-containing protein [Melghirimyces algeriensis]|uniref:DUF2642 domain-containing protein n=1 Tax=Melghirimyces algeriensis TaxID=910412 RepID=UPI00163DD04A|nr:DUF2642 domain-containing protein [Melghirimyces algeriensis]
MRAKFFFWCKKLLLDLLCRVRELERQMAEVQERLELTRAGDFARLQELFQSLLNNVVTIFTPFGDVTGEVTNVGEDFVELESGGDIILVPYANITFVNPA